MKSSYMDEVVLASILAPSSPSGRFDILYGCFLKNNVTPADAFYSRGS